VLYNFYNIFLIYYLYLILIEQNTIRNTKFVKEFYKAEIVAAGFVLLYTSIFYWTGSIGMRLVIIYQ
jgi:hypothetical protein